MRSSRGSASLATKALAAASRTFSSPATLPLSSESTSDSNFLDGRRRLSGAFFIDINRIEPDASQPRKRFDAGTQQELNASVARLGIIQPITVRYIEGQEKYRIITGQRRFEAAKVAKLKEVPCWVQTPEDSDVLLHQIVENWQRADMHPYDLADALARLRDENGYSQKRLAEYTGKSKSDISKLLALLELDPAVQKIAREDSTGRLGRRHLYPLIQLPPTSQQKAIARIQRDEPTAAQVEQLVVRMMDEKHGVKKRGAPVKRLQFRTATATVTVVFRKRDVSPDEIVSALDEARGQAVVETENQDRSIGISG